MNPALSTVKVDKILTPFSQRYSNSSYISEMIAPPMKVVEKTGKYAKYGTENLRVYADQTFRAPGTRANQIDFSVSQGAYVCQEHSLEKLVPDEYLKNTDKPYDVRRDAVATIMDNIWVNQEYTLAQYMTSTSNLTQNTTLSGSSQWNNDTSDPFGDIQTGIDTIRAATGQIPNSCAMNYKVMQTLKRHPAVREQLKYTGSAGLSDSAFVTFLKEHFNLKNVHVGTAIYNSAQEGQTDVLGDVWNKDFYLFYKNDRPTLMQATFAYTFYDVPRETDMYRDEPKRSDVVRLRYSYDQNVMDVSLAYLIKNAVA